MSDIHRILLTSLILTAGATLAQKRNCFHKMTAKSGKFHSPHYPMRYPANYRCEYRIRSPPEYFVEINFTSFRLEDSFGGQKSDFIRILDGGSQNRKKDLTFDGKRKTPFTFRSATNRVSILFESNELFEYSGFAANYEQLKKCVPPKVANGRVHCDVDSLNLATRCNVTCDADEVTQRMLCRDGAFPEVRCASTCGLEALQRYGPSDCVLDNVTREIVSCAYSCPANYVDTGSGRLRCENGSLVKKPECLPDLELMMGDCDSNSTDCEIDKNSELRAVLESSRNFELQLGRSIRGSNNGCDREVCRMNKKATRYYWRCKSYLNLCQRWFREGKNKRKQRKTMCKSCQRTRCGDSHRVVER